MTSQPNPKPYHYHFVSPSHANTKPIAKPSEYIPYQRQNGKVSFQYGSQSSEKNGRKNTGEVEKPQNSLFTERPSQLHQRYVFSMLGTEQMSGNKLQNWEPSPPCDGFPRQHPLLFKKSLKTNEVKEVTETSKKLKSPKTPKIKVKTEAISDDQDTQRKSQVQQLKKKVQFLTEENDGLKVNLKQVKEQAKRQKLRLQELLEKNKNVINEKQQRLERIGKQNQELRIEVKNLNSSIQNQKTKNSQLKLYSETFQIQINNIEKVKEGKNLKVDFKAMYEFILDMLNIQSLSENHRDLLTDRIIKLKSLQQQAPKLTRKIEDQKAVIRNMSRHIEKCQIQISKLNLLVSRQLPKYQLLVDSYNVQLMKMNLTNLDHKLKTSQLQQTLE